MSCHTTVCLGTMRTCDGVHVDLDVDRRSGAVIGASVAGTRLLATNVLPCAVPSKLAAHLHRGLTAHAATSTQPASFYLLGPGLTETRCGDLVISQLIRCLLVEEEAQTAASPAMSSRSEMASECIVFGSEDDAVTCETLAWTDSVSAIDRVLSRIHHITLVAARFANCVCLVVVSTQLNTAHIASLASSATKCVPSAVYLYLGDTMTTEEMQLACSELEAVKATVADFAAPLIGVDSRAVPPQRPLPRVGAAPASVSRVLNTTVSDDGRRDSQPTDTDARRELRWLRAELARVEADRDAAEMERRACQGVLQAYRERFSEMDTRDVALLHAITGDSDARRCSHRRGDDGGAAAADDGESARLIAQLREQLEDVTRALYVAEEKTRLLEFREDMRSQGHVNSPSASTEEEVEALRRENLDLAALLQQKDHAAQVATEALQAKLDEAERAKAAMAQALEIQSRTIREAKEAVLAERARHDVELTGALDAVKALSRDNSRGGSTTSPHHAALPMRSPSLAKPPCRHQRRYATPRGSVQSTNDADVPDRAVSAAHSRQNSRSIIAPLTSPLR